jgi:tetratricopeptide (TPR) repeat protein
LLLLAAALTSLATWQLVRDLRPLPELTTVESLIHREKLEEAQAALRVILEHSPRHGTARRMLAQLLAKRGDLLGCARELGRIPFWWPDRRDEQFLEGQAWLDSRRARDAEQAFLGCVRDDPLHPADPDRVAGAAKALVTLYLLEERIPEAHDVLWQAYTQASPAERGPILNMHMRAEIERIEPKEAAATLREYAAADSSDWQARRALAHAEELQGNRSEANSLIAACLRERPDSVEGWRMWLTILADRNQPEALAEAIAAMPATVRRADDSTIQELQGIDRINAQEFERAFERLEAALRVDPQNPDLHFRLAGVAQRLGRPDLAETHRATSHKIRKARQAIPEALLAYRDCQRPAASAAGRAQRALAMENLAQICETVGWERLGEEWHKLAGAER